MIMTQPEHHGDAYWPASKVVFKDCTLELSDGTIVPLDNTADDENINPEAPWVPVPPELVGLQLHTNEDGSITYTPLPGVSHIHDVELEPYAVYIRADDPRLSRVWVGKESTSGTLDHSFMDEAFVEPDTKESINPEVYRVEDGHTFKVSPWPSMEGKCHLCGHPETMHMQKETQ